MFPIAHGFTVVCDTAVLISDGCIRRLVLLRLKLVT